MLDTNKYVEIDRDVAQELIGLTFDSEWEFYGILRQTVLAGIVLIKNSEIHCWRNSSFNGRWLTRQDIQHILNHIKDEYGTVTTSVMKSNEVGHRFVQRLGFKPSKEDDKVRYYEMERLNHERL